jgi:hypothetical protein
MKVVIASVAMVAVCAAGIVLAQSDKSKNTETYGTHPEPKMLGRHWAKGQAKNGAGSYGGDAPLAYHNGEVVEWQTEVHPIFWGAKWADSTFVGDKISGLALFYAGATSHYLSTNTEYTDSTTVHTSDLIVAPGPSYLDTGAAPAGAPQPIQILNEVCRLGSALKEHSYYPVYVDTKRGNTGYCAWHSSGFCGTKKVDFAFFFNLDGDSGCDPHDATSGHSQGLAALANVSGHELSERQTDANGDAWYDDTSSEYENSDKCAWTFGQNLLTFSNGTVWKVQGNWSNVAHDAGQGYVDHTYFAGTKFVGCIDGTN